MILEESSRKTKHREESRWLFWFHTIYDDHINVHTNWNRCALNITCSRTSCFWCMCTPHVRINDYIYNCNYLTRWRKTWCFWCRAKRFNFVVSSFRNWKREEQKKTIKPISLSYRHTLNLWWGLHEINPFWKLKTNFPKRLTNDFG